MKTDLDSLMHSYNLDAVLILGPASHNAAMMYMTGGGHFTGELLKKRGEAPVLFCRTMERDEAARTGLATKLIDDYKPMELLKQASGDPLKATVLRYQQMFADFGVTLGRVALYGQIDAGVAFATFSAVQAVMPGLTFVGELNNSMIYQAMMTKEEAEIARIRQMGKITTGVVGQVADFLSSSRLKGEMLVKADGTLLTIADIKNRINLWLAERGAENPEGTIFAIGRDAGVPHSAGIPTEVLRLGQSIVFDIYPCEVGGGYYYDFTRTWCLGYAPEAVQALYEQVLDVYRTVTAELQVNTPFKNYQNRVCDLYEAQGHETIRKNPQCQQGYIHSLGHGLGLHVHERPWSGANADDADRLVPGAVFTIEPGLYYPERGMGVRLEDTYWMRPDGKAELLADYPLDLILPMAK